MNSFRKARPQYLYEWLEIATRKLAPTAKERIWADVAAHYEEAVEGHLEQGLPTSAAHHAALAELGDAKAAARRFRREHLTESEYRKFTKLLKNQRHGWIWHGAILSGSLLIGLNLPNLLHARLDPELCLIAWLLLFVLFEIVIFVLTRHDTQRRLISITAWSWFSWGLVLALPPTSSGRPDYVGMAYGLFFLHQGLSYLRLSNKLGKAVEEWMMEAAETRNELPPEDPIPS